MKYFKPVINCLLFTLLLLTAFALTTYSESSQKEAESSPQIEIPLDKQRLIGVKIGKVQVIDLRKTIRTTGKLDFDERSNVVITSKIGGWVERLYVDYTGKYVKKGEPLLEIYSQELLAAQQEYINLIRWESKYEGRESKSEIETLFRKDQRALAEAAHARLKTWHMTDDQIKSLRDSGKPYRTFTLYSEHEGYTTRKDVTLGMRINAGERLFTITDTKNLWVIADIYEYDIPYVKTGMPVVIRLSYMPEREFRTVIEFIHPLIAGDTRTSKARMTIKNPTGDILKAQMLTEVEIRIDLGKRLTVPEDALIDTGKRRVVYVDKGNGYFEPRTVITGIKTDGMVEILKGLKAGDRIALSANFLIDSESKLKGIAQ